MKNTPTPWMIALAAMAFVGGFSRLAAQTTTTILATDFGSLSNNLPSGYSSGAVVPGTTGSLSVQNTTSKLFIGADGNGNLQFTSQFNQGNPGFGVYQAISNGASYAQITGSISFSFLTFGTNIPSTNFAITNSVFGSTSGVVSSMQFGVNGTTGVFSFFNGSTTPTLIAGDNYTVTFSIDYTNKTQNTASFTLTDTTTGSVVSTATNINTRAANITPTSFFITSSGGTTASNPAFLDISQITLSGVSAIPEPSTYALLMAGGLFAFCTWNRRR